MPSILEDSCSSENSENELSIQEILQQSKTKSLAMLMQRRDSIRHMETLRKVHSSKLKLQKQMLK